VNHPCPTRPRPRKSPKIEDEDEKRERGLEFAHGRQAPGRWQGRGWRGGAAFAGGAEEDLFEAGVGRFRPRTLLGDFSSVPSMTLPAVFSESGCAEQISSTRWRQVRADDDRRAIARPLQDGILHPPDAVGIQAGERLVEIDDPGEWSRPQRWRASVSCRATARQAGRFSGRQLELLSSRPARGSWLATW